MSRIQVLDQVTIDKIAAGEVIERPASIVKELLENAIDAGATSITVEIRDGGISFIRVTDNGCGIEMEDIPAAFLRHSTSKIRSAEDLSHISSLGFRGEALSSIAAVAQVELITKTKGSTFGASYRIEGGKGGHPEETGAPDGTTFLVRQLFYNTPARRKFLKTPMTEASHVGDLVTRLSLSHPEISFLFRNNGQSRLHTSGNGSLRDVIYHVYGREIASHLLEVDLEGRGVRITGCIGEPLVSRGNRNFENYFINGRYVKSSIISKAIEDAYKDFQMQHKYPFTVLHIQVDTEIVDVNVHPTKMEVRFQNQQEIYGSVCEAVSRSLHHEELIPQVAVPEPPEAIPERQVPENGGGVPATEKTIAQNTAENVQKQSVLYKKQSAYGSTDEPKGEKQSALFGSEPENAGQAAQARTGREPQKDLDYFMKKMRERVLSYHQQAAAAEVREQGQIHRPEEARDRIREAAGYRVETEKTERTPEIPGEHEEKTEYTPKQLNLFEEKLLSPQAASRYRIIGQVFETYWLVEFGDNLYIIDQHAAHERVLYEKTLAGMKTRDFTSQVISPPIILSLTMQEAQLLNTYMDQFTRVGFEIEEFGQDSYAVRAVPDNLFGIAKRELLMEMIDSLSDELYTGLAPDIIDEKIASMSCKAAVKGNMRLSAREVEALIGELLQLENPYHCPHGRPTIIAMSRRELEKKFKRIV